MAELEKLNLKVRGSLFSLDLAQLKDVCKVVKITEQDIEGKGKMAVIQLVMSALDNEEKSEDGGLATLGAVEDMITLLTTDDPSSSTTSPTKELQDAIKLTAALNRKEFKIHGQIGKPGQNEKLSYHSLIRQIEEGIEKKYTEREVVAAVITATSHGMPLRLYLESRKDLTLPKLRRLLRGHYREKDALTAYQELTSASQHSKETPQDFVMRVMNIRQLLEFASQEESSPLSYDISTIRSTFIQTLNTGLEEQVRVEMKGLLEAVEIPDDEDILEAVNAAVSLDEKRSLKRTRLRPKVSEVQVTSKTPEPDMLEQLMTGMNELRCTVSALQNAMTQPKESSPPRPRGNGNQRSTSARGCEKCRKDGIGQSCTHCYKCGSNEHYARGCKLSRKQGNGSRASRGDRE